MKSLYLSLLSLLLVPSVSAQVIINEIMQSNIDCIMDDLNDFPDSWVELYNTATTSQNLSDYKLGTSTDVDAACSLPSMVLSSHGYKVVYCDKVEGKNWHMPFRLESGKGCAIYLFKGTEIVDSISGLKKQPSPNIAYGRSTDGSSAMGYLTKPTPNASNCGVAVAHDNILGEPLFSVPGCVFESSNSFTLQLSVPEGTPSESKIRYTTNGSEPTASSAIFPASGLKISSSRVIRAKIFCDGYLSPRSTVQSYLFLSRQMTLPVVSISTDNKYLNDSKIGIYVEGSYKSGVKNYQFDWRRPIQLELFDAPASASVLNQLCETRIQGGATRSAQLKSLALYAHKRFGTKKFDYEFFPEDKPEQTNFKSLLLRNAGNDFDYLYMRDAIIQRVMAKHVDVDWQAWRPAIVFINGVYKGIQNFRERSNDDNVYTNYDGLEDVEVIENWRDVKTGTGTLFADFQNYINEHGHTWAEFDERMDVSEFLDVMIMDLYFNNLDAPGNNFTIWRPTDETGRWRVILKDVDYTMGLYGDPYNYQILNWINSQDYDSNHNWGANSWEGTRLFRRLMEDNTFKEAFFDRCCVYMGDFMNLDGVWKVWEPMYEKIKTEYPKHRALINQWWPNYNDEMNNAKNWLKNRTSYFYSHLCSYYGLGSPMPLQVNKNLSEGELQQMKVAINGVPLSEGVFDGKFPQNREVRLTGENVVRWEVTTQTSSGSTKKTYSGAEAKFTMPSCVSVKVVAVAGEAEGIDNLQPDQNGHRELFYDMCGRKQNQLQRGVNILVTPQGNCKVLKK